MKAHQLDVFRKALTARAQEIDQLNKDSKDAADTVALDQSKVGRLSRMDAMQAQRWHKKRHAGDSNNYRKLRAHCIVWRMVTTATASHAAMPLTLAG